MNEFLIRIQKNIRNLWVEGKLPLIGMNDILLRMLDYTEVSMVVVGDLSCPAVDMSEVVQHDKGGNDLLSI